MPLCHISFQILYSLECRRQIVIKDCITPRYLSNGYWTCQSYVPALPIRPVLRYLTFLRSLTLIHYSTSNPKQFRKAPHPITPTSAVRFPHSPRAGVVRGSLSLEPLDDGGLQGSLLFGTQLGNTERFNKIIVAFSGQIQLNVNECKTFQIGVRVGRICG